MNKRVIIGITLIIMIFGTLVMAFAEDTNAKEGNEFNIGSSVFFGHYEQDGKTANGDEAIEWIVLNKFETTDRQG